INAADDMKGVSLPLLEEVSGDLIVTGTALECLSMPQLNRVGRTLVIDDNDSLARTDVAALVDVGLAADAEGTSPAVAVKDNGALQELNLNALRHIGQA